METCWLSETAGVGCQKRGTAQQAPSLPKRVSALCALSDFSIALHVDSSALDRPRLMSKDELLSPPRTLLFVAIDPLL